SAADGDAGGTLHRLQLVSGRPLKAFPVDRGSAPVDIVDLAITRNGTVLLLDASGGRLLALHPGAASIQTAVRIDVPAPSSLAAGSDESVAYLAHRDGISRIDLRAKTTTPLRAPKD